MEGLRLRDEVRLFLADDGGPAAPATVGHARELHPPARRARRPGCGCGAALAAALLVGAGWFAHAELGLFVDQVAAAHPVPAFAAEAAAVAGHAAGSRLAAGAAPEAGGAAAAPRTGGEVPVPDARATGCGWCGSDLVPLGRRHGVVAALPRPGAASWSACSPARPPASTSLGRAGATVAGPRHRVLADRPLRLRAQRRRAGGRAARPRPRRPAPRPWASLRSVHHQPREHPMAEPFARPYSTRPLGEPGRVRRGPAAAHAAGLQLHDAGPGADRHRRLRRRHHAGALRADLRHAAEVGGDAGAAGVRVLLHLPHPDACRPARRS